MTQYSLPLKLVLADWKPKLAGRYGQPDLVPQLHGVRSPFQLRRLMAKVVKELSLDDARNRHCKRCVGRLASAERDLEALEFALLQASLDSIGRSIDVPVQVPEVSIGRSEGPMIISSSTLVAAAGDLR